MKYICAFLLLLAFKGYAQYPFEKFPVKKYDSVKFKLIDINDSTQINVAHYKDYTIKLVRDRAVLLGGKILLYYKNQLIKTADGNFGGMMRDADFPLYIEDVNDDGMPDIIFQTYNSSGTGLASEHIYSAYFISEGKHNFQVLNFGSFYDKPQREYQLTNHGDYLIVGQSLAYYKGHSYWIFDLYKYEKGRLINVSNKYGYPIAVPYLNKETFIPTNKIPIAALRSMSMKKPDFNSATP